MNMSLSFNMAILSSISLDMLQTHLWLWLTAPFNNTWTMKFKTQLTILLLLLRFLLPIKLRRQPTQTNGPWKKSTNHNPRTWTFEWITKWLTAAKNETVDWAEFQRVRMLLKSAVRQQLFSLLILLLLEHHYLQNFMVVQGTFQGSRIKHFSYPKPQHDFFCWWYFCSAIHLIR